MQDDLRGLIEGDVRCDDLTSRLYATDAGPFESPPHGVVWPRSTEDIVTCFKYAEEKKIPLHPRGAGSGKAGGALGPGLVLDTTRYMKRILRIDEESILVQSGAVLFRLNETLRESQRRFFAPDPGFAPTTTIGSVLASDGAGPHWLRHGSPRDHLLGLQVVLSDGEVLELENKPQNGPAVSEPQARLARDVRNILEPRLSEIERERPLHSPDRTGYRLEGVLGKAGKTPPANETGESNPAASSSPLHASSLASPGSNGVNLARLIVGSEGTLALITEARLRTVPLPSAEGGVLFLFDSLEKATRTIPSLLQHDPGRCDLLDRRKINMVREWDKRFQPLLTQESEAVLFVEVDGEARQDVEDRLQEMVEDIHFREHLCFRSQIASNPGELAIFRELFRKGELALARMPVSVKTISLFDEIAVPTETLPAFLIRIQNLFKRNEMTASYSGHLGHGNLRVQPILGVAHGTGGAFLARLAEEVFEAVVRQGGTIGCSGVCGLASTRFLPLQHENLMPLFRQIKELFDPKNLLNPGKVIPGDDRDWDEHLRSSFRGKK